jgi:signal transduction histidine kinase
MSTQLDEALNDLRTALGGLRSAMLAAGSVGAKALADSAGKLATHLDDLAELTGGDDKNPEARHGTKD